MVQPSPTGINSAVFFFIEKYWSVFARIMKNNTLGLRFAVNIDYLLVSYTIFTIRSDGSVHSLRI